MSDKISPQHLARKAMLYIRQSSTYQVSHNVESQRLQYAMQDRLHQLGWQEIEVVDEDLGRSAAGMVTRAGFERMVADVCFGKVGAVAAREVSRFARNSREWQQLVEVCRVVDTVLVDLETVYSPRHSNDRLLLGLKGSLNEYELDLVRQRSVEARRAKAQRGELLVMAPVGYIKTEAPISRKIRIGACRTPSPWCSENSSNWGRFVRRSGGSWSTACHCPCRADTGTPRGNARPTPCCIACSVIRCTAAPMRTGKPNGLSTMTTANRVPVRGANRARDGWL
jgi:DNA invertase Pin-like site-specific DNA recombinase